MVDKALVLEENRQKLLKEIDELKSLQLKNFNNKKVWTKAKKEKLETLEEEKYKSHEVWVFFDEFNTSVLQDYIGEIMLKRTSSLLDYHEKVNHLNI